jgi:hypothetical protein
MGNSTIWYSIEDSDYPQCDDAMVFTYAPTQYAEKIAESFAMELAFVTRLDPEKIKVWVE